MKPMVDRRSLLQGSLGALLGLIDSPAFADVLVTDNEALAGGDGVMAAQMRLGEYLIRYIAAHKGGSASERAKADPNVVVSPASLAAILSLIDLGGSPAMHQGIHRALGYKRSARRKAEKELLAMRSSVSAIIAQSRKDGPLALANLVAFDRSVRPKQLAMFGLSGAGADVLVDNLSNPKIVDRINGWVNEKTNKLIPTILDEAPDTLGLVAVNALYFKDRWQIPFEPSRTQAEQFQTISGKPADVQMMHSKVGKFSFRQDDRFIATDLGYANENFRLVVITTKAAAAQPQDF